MIKMIATDLDGTLLAAGGTAIPQRNLDALARAVELGVRVVVCTGRMFTGALRFARLVPGDQPAVCVNGAVVRMTRSLSYVRRVGVPQALAREALELMRQGGAQPWFYVGDTCYAEAMTEPLAAMQKRTGVAVELVPDLGACVGRKPEKILCVQPDEQTAALRRAFERQFGARLYVTLSHPWQLEVLAPAATKGKALAEVAAAFGIEKSETAAFGDALNDLELFEAAGIKVAMGNAEAELKARADLIAPTNDEGGVGAVVERLLEA